MGILTFGFVLSKCWIRGDPVNECFLPLWIDPIDVLEIIFKCLTNS